MMRPIHRHRHAIEDRIYRVEIVSHEYHGDTKRPRPVEKQLIEPCGHRRIGPPALGGPPSPFENAHHVAALVRDDAVY